LRHPIRADLAASSLAPIRHYALVLLAGALFALMGVIGEVTGGTFFRHFFEPGYPKPMKGLRRWQDDVWIKVLGFRLMFALGVLLLAVGALQLIFAS